MDRIRSDVALTPARLAVWYAIAGSVWIVWSDTRLGAFDSWASARTVSLGKGLGFVVVTAVVLYLLLRRRSIELSATEGENRRLGELSKSVLDSVHFPIAVIDHGGEILNVNEAWTHFSSANGGSVTATGIGVNYLDVCRTAAILDPSLHRVMTGIAEVLEDRTDSYAFEYPCHSPIEERWFRMEASAIPGVGAVIVHWNTTSDHVARNALERTIEAKDEFLAGISHELRTPLTAVVGFAEHLHSGDVEAGEAEELQAMLAHEARHVADLVEDLLLAGRLDSDTITVRSEIISLPDVVESAVRPFIYANGADITIEADDPDPEALADPLRVRQIVRNLVGNAVHHGGEKITVRMRLVEDEWAICVCDSGSGIPDHAVERMFQPYGTATDRVGRPNSIGLGLYLSRRLAERMGGGLAYRRVDDETVFTLTLPPARRSTADLASPTPGVRLSERWDGSV